MKIKNEQEIVDISERKNYESFIEDECFIAGYTQAQQDTLASASEGFEEWKSNLPEYARIDELTMLNCERSWQAAILSQAKDFKKLSDAWEEAATQNYSDK